MAQLKPGSSDLGIPSDIVPPDVRVHLTRLPFDDFFNLAYALNGRNISEELEPDATRQWFKDHMAKAASRELELKRDEAIGKAMDECWNFGRVWITIPGDVYVEPVKPFPAFQPQV